MTARTDRAALRPSSRAVSFSATTASAVSGGTSALSSAVFRSLSDTNGMPAASSTCALEVTFSGTLGLFWMPLKNDELNAEMSTAPASAAGRQRRARARAREDAPAAAAGDRAQPPPPHHAAPHPPAPAPPPPPPAPPRPGPPRAPPRPPPRPGPPLPAKKQDAPAR